MYINFKLNTAAGIRKREEVRRKKNKKHVGLSMTSSYAACEEERAFSADQIH